MSDEMRREFEEWAEPKGYDLLPAPNWHSQTYFSTATEDAYRGYAAGRAAAEKDVSRINYLERESMGVNVELDKRGNPKFRLSQFSKWYSSLRAAIDAANTQRS